MDAITHSLPTGLFPDEATPRDDSPPIQTIAHHVWFVDDHGSRVVFCRHEPIFQVSLDDPIVLRFVAVQLRLMGLANQQEIARAWGHSVRSQRQWEILYQQDGIRGLERKPGSGRPSLVDASQEGLVRKWFQQGVTSQRMAQRLGVSLDVVKRVLKRLGLRRRNSTVQGSLSWSDEADAAPDTMESPAVPLVAVESHERVVPAETTLHVSDATEPPAAISSRQTVQAAAATDSVVSETARPAAVVLETAASHPTDDAPPAEPTVSSESPSGPLPATPPSDPPPSDQPPSTLPVVHVGGGTAVVGKVEVIRIPVSELDTYRHPSVPASATSETAATSSTRTPAEDPKPSRSVSSPAPAASATDAAPRGFTVDLDPHDRSGDRALARLGILEDALPMFAPTEQLPRAGVLVVVPLLRTHGLLDAFEQVYAGALGPSFYGLRTMVVTLLLCALLRIKRPEQLKEHAPWDVGGLLGLDRAPEVKTVRRKLTRLAEQNRAAELMAALARRRIAADDTRVAFLYVDGHVREDHGQQPLAKAKKAQRPVARKGATDTWVNDARGEPLLVVTSELNEGLTLMLEPVLAEVRQLVGPRRVTVIFDRGGFHLQLFARLIAAGFDLITYRKGPSRDRPRREFQPHTLTVEGRVYSYELCDRGRVRVGRLRPKRKREFRGLGPQFLWLREVRVLRRDERQTPILTNLQDLSGAEVAYRAFDRWRLENYLKYGVEEFALDALVEYQAREVSAAADRPNPARKRIQQKLRRARGEVSRLKAELGQAAEGSSTRTMRGFRIVQSRLRRELGAAEAEVQKLRQSYAKLPARVSASDLKTLTTEKKLIVDVIKMSAYQLETQLLGLIQETYSRSADEGRTLLHAVFQTPGKLEVTPSELRITLQPQSSPHRTAVVRRLCDQLNQLETYYPGTHLRLNLAVEPHLPEDSRKA